MEINYREIAERALCLPPEKRVSLAKFLLESVQGTEDVFLPTGDEDVASAFRSGEGDVDSESEIERLWAEEALRRLERFRAGHSVAVDADEVFRRVRVDIS